MSHNPVIKLVHRATRALNHRFLRLIPASDFAASIYYAFLDPSFKRELAAVYAGKREQVVHKDRVTSARFTLRRNIHRLEKGLIMKDRRETFALDYIGETISCFERVYPADLAELDRQSEIRWFVDVLTNYFNSITIDGKTAPLREIFQRLAKDHPRGEAPSVPYPRSESAVAAVGYDELFQLFRRRRSVRWFEDKRVPRELIDQAVLAALQAPSACNRQPFHFHIIDDPEKLKLIGAIPMGTKGYAENIPALVVIVGQLNAYFNERDRHLIYIDGSLAAMSYMLALETLGLASCPINWPDMEAKEQQMDAALGLKPWERPIMLIATGFPDPAGGVAFSQKSPLTAMRRFI